MAKEVEATGTMTARFTYFKPSGKYYTDDFGEVPAMPKGPLTRDTIKKYNKGVMPGLSGNGDDFFIVVDPADSYPVLICPKAMDK